MVHRLFNWYGIKEDGSEGSEIISSKKQGDQWMDIMYGQSLLCRELKQLVVKQRNFVFAVYNVRKHQLQQIVIELNS